MIRLHFQKPSRLFGIYKDMDCTILVPEHIAVCCWDMVQFRTIFETPSSTVLRHGMLQYYLVFSTPPISHKMDIETSINFCPISWHWEIGRCREPPHTPTLCIYPVLHNPCQPTWPPGRLQSLYRSTRSCMCHLSPENIQTKHCIFPGQCQTMQWPLH